MIQIIDKEVSSDSGLRIIRKGSDAPFRRGRALPGDTEADYAEVPDDWEEVCEAKAAKLAEIDAYDTSEAVNSFTLSGRRLWLDNALRISITDSMRKERAAGLTHTTLWHEGIRYDLPIDEAERMLIALEVYAKQCFNTTAAHRAAVAALTSAADIAAYDHTAGYPPSPEF